MAYQYQERWTKLSKRFAQNCFQCLQEILFASKSRILYAIKVNHLCIVLWQRYGTKTTKMCSDEWMYCINTSKYIGHLRLLFYQKKTFILLNASFSHSNEFIDYYFHWTIEELYRIKWYFKNKSPFHVFHCILYYLAHAYFEFN